MKPLPLSTKLFLLVLLPICGLVGLGVRSSLRQWTIYRDYVVLERNSAILQQIGSTVHELQKERGRSAGFLGSKGAQFSAELRDQRQATDAAVARLAGLLRDFDAARFGPAFAQRLRAGLDELGRLEDQRSAITAFRRTGPESTAYYTGTIAALLDVVVAMSHLSKDADIGNGISCYVNFLLAKEQAGIERATLTGVFVADTFTPESFRRFSQVRAAQDTYLRVFASFATDAQRQFVAATVTGPAVAAVDAMRETALTKSATGGFGIVASAWFDASSARLNLFKQVEDRLAADYAADADAIKLGARRDFLLLSGFTALLLVVTLAATGWILRSITRGLLDLAARLAEGSTEVSSAATQVSAAS